MLRRKSELLCERHTVVLCIILFLYFDDYIHHLSVFYHSYFNSSLLYFFFLSYSITLVLFSLSHIFFLSFFFSFNLFFFLLHFLPYFLTYFLPSPLSLLYPQRSNSNFHRSIVGDVDRTSRGGVRNEQSVQVDQTSGPGPLPMMNKTASKYSYNERVRDIPFVPSKECSDEVKERCVLVPYLLSYIIACLIFSILFRSENWSIK